MRSMIWKELRQGRPLLLFSVIAGLALAAADVVAVRLKAGQGYPGGPGAGLEAPLTAALVVLPLFLALLAGSGLFAAETDHGTIPVLFALPLSRRRIWALKALCGLLLAGAACALLLGISRWLMAPVYDHLPLRPWPDLALSALVVFAVALFTTALTPHVVGATVAAIPLAIGLVIGGVLAGDPFGGMLLGYDKYLEIELWAALAVPALLFASVRAVVRGELLEWNRSALLHLPLVLVGMALMVLLAAGLGRATTGYSRHSVHQINANPAQASPSVAVVLSYSRPVPYQRGRTMVGLQAGDRPSWQTGSHFERRPSDWEDPAAGRVDGGPLYRNTSAVILDLKAGRELGVVREPLYTNEVNAAVSPDGRVAAVASGRMGLTWGYTPWDRGARFLTIVDLKARKRLFSGTPAATRQRPDGWIDAMAWSPHGKYLAAEIAGGTYLLQRDGKLLRALPVRFGNGQAAWSTTEEALYGIAEGGLTRTDAATGRSEVIWRPQASFSSGSLSLLPGGVSPDDRWMAVASAETPSAQAERPGTTALLAVPTGKGEAQTIWQSPQPAILSAAWSRDGRTLYVLVLPQEERNAWKERKPQVASLLRWRVGEPTCTEAIASLPYFAATLTPLADGVLVYPVRVFEEKQYTMRHEPLPPTGGPFIVGATGPARPFPDAASSLKFAAENDLVTVDAAGRIITVEGRPGSKVVRAWEGTQSVRVYP